ncbi:MAG: hypothetical protein QW548_03020 [Candidatus Aenigmatarchaeota archaeon]
MAEKHLVGKVTHFYGKIGVAVVELSDALRTGDRILIESGDGSIEQVVDSMQVEHKPISEANKGQSVGLKVSGKVRPGASVFKLA